MSDTVTLPRDIALRLLAGTRGTPEGDAFRATLYPAWAVARAERLDGMVVG